ncbi:hypothetical protein [Sporosarcina sp. FA9]|uniref:hypothetical protein n=1 Tax=Sporosarcina sp. FA9 TaxID=3413030 RepID=UPI003F65EEA9
MFQQSPLPGNKLSDDSSTQDRGAILGIIGAAISTFGDALQTIGGIVALEEGRIADAQQQQVLENLQNQIDDLKKENEQKNSVNVDMDMLSKLMGKIVERLDNKEWPK